MNLRLTAIAVLDATILNWAWPNFASLRAVAASPSAWIAAQGTDEAAARLATTLLWATAAWLAIGLAAAILASLPGLPGSTGRLAQSVARFVLPRAALQFISGAAGLGIVLSPAAALATTGHLPAPQPPTSSTSQASPTFPAPLWPTTQPAPTTQSRARSVPTSRAVTVKPGDSLWSIARAHLPGEATDSQIAAAWPAWYEANRRAIGRDPAHLVPGERLRQPTSTATAEDAP